MINPQTVCIAPMLDWTDRHTRYFLRQISQRVYLYTEMITTKALLSSGQAEKLLTYNKEEHPLALQLGGNDPAELAQCAVLAEQYGYDEVNLNLGCPSNRVQAGCFGAALMAEPDLVIRCLQAMNNAVSIPVTVKLRLGIDHLDNYHYFYQFVSRLADEAHCQTFIIHARKAWLNGLSPKENRSIPPLCYDWVYQLKQQRTELNIIINGGITDLESIERHLQYVDGVMIGREAYHNPYLLSTVDQRFYASKQPSLTRRQVLDNMRYYINQQQQQGVALKHITRHLLGLFQGCAGARHFRRVLSDNQKLKENNSQLLLQAVEHISSSSCL